MKKNTLRKVLIIMLFVGLMWILPNIVNAAYISVTPSKTIANSGERVNVTINSDCVGRINLSVSNGAISSDRVWIEGGSQSVTVTVGSSGNTTITAAPQEGQMSSNGNDVNVATVRKKINISTNTNGNSNNGNSTSGNNGKTETNTNNNSNTKSNNANLLMIETQPVDFKGFSQNKQSGYSVTLENEADRITFSYKKANANSTVNIINKTNGDTGKTWVKVSEGENVINVIVTAEDGKTQKTYTINVTRKTKDDNSTENETTEETTNETTSEDEVEDPTAQAFGLTKLSIAGVELQPQFQTDVYEYRIELKENLDKLDIKAIATEENANVEITGNENLQDGENIITILVKGDTEDKNVAYQIIVNKSVEKQEETNTNANKIKNIIIVSTVAVLVLIVIIIIVVSKVKSKKNEAFIPYGGVFEDNDVNENDSFNNYDNNNDSNIEENNDFEEYEEEKPKKKRSKGKRFK